MRIVWQRDSALVTNILYKSDDHSSMKTSVFKKKHPEFSLTPFFNVAETDVHRGRQERRRQPEHQRGSSSPAQTQREPASTEGQTDV